jgi:two-component system sensor histidine kinase MprB
VSLRTKLVLALVVCTSVASAAVGALSYRSTQQRLMAEVDASLENAVRVLTGELERRGPGAVGRSLVAVGEIEVQFVAADGETRSRQGVDGIPVSSADVDVAAASRAGVRLLRSDVWDDTAPDDTASDDPGSDNTGAEGDLLPGGQVGPDPREPLPGEPDISAGDPIRILTESLGSRGGAIQAVRSLEETERVLSALRSRILVVALAVAAASGIAGWVIARQVTGRLVSVTDAAEGVAATGSLDVEVPVAGSDEAARLGSAFNEMMAALSQSRADQQRLVQDAGHELRTPMTSLRTNLYNLRSFESMDPESREVVLADLESETEELSRLIDEVVEVATDRRGDEPLAEVDLADLARRVAEKASLRWEREVRVQVSGEPVLLGRREALTRAVRNLVENACKFDPSGARVQVVVRALPGDPAEESGPWEQPSVQVEVLDQGPGMEPADLEHVFERFYRSNDARSAPGSGLGLSIVAEVVAGHGGICWASNRPGGGAAVCFRIPVG